MDAILPYLALSSSIFAILAVLFSKVRPRFPIKVNCWFCQKDLVVPYHERNSWDCPYCEQYNGFSADGGYNKVISAHYNVLMNPEVTKKSAIFKTRGNLCQSCTLNQELKVQQLASFSPKNEESFNSEINHFKSHLEHVYRLCRYCDQNLEMKLGQEERLLKPAILSWKLELSKQHNLGANQMVKQVYNKWACAARSTVYVCSWMVLTASLFHFWIINHDVDTFSADCLFYLEVLTVSSKVFNSIGLGCSISNALLVKNKNWNVAYIIVWFVMLIPSFVSLAKWDLLWPAFILAAIVVSEILSNASRKVRKCVSVKSKKQKKTMTKEHKLSSSDESKDSSRSSILHHSTPKSNAPCDLDISKLDIGSPNKTAATNAEFSKSPSIRTQGFARPKPIISPSRLGHSNLSLSNGNLTKASWVAGGYWQSNNWQSPSFVASPNYSYPLSRSSSQSSGFGSIQTALHNRSPPDSRPGSPFADMDRLSVFSVDNYEPRYSEPNQRYDQLPVPSAGFQGGSDLSRRSVISPGSVISESKTSLDGPSSLPSHWSWLPFMFGFSLAVNVCVLGYSLLHSTSNHV